MSSFYINEVRLWHTSSSLRLETATFSTGVIRPSSSGGQEVNYFLKDHLGSIRVIVNASGAELERNDYYPFGSPHPRSDYRQLSSNRFKYNGKEKQTTGDVNYLDYGARMYDTRLGRWLTPDPLAEKYFQQSSYAYCFSNPINVVDPDGRDGIYIYLFLIIKYLLLLVKLEI